MSKNHMWSVASAPLPEKETAVSNDQLFESWSLELTNLRLIVRTSPEEQTRKSRPAKGSSQSTRISCKRVTCKNTLQVTTPYPRQ